MAEEAKEAEVKQEVPAAAEAPAKEAPAAEQATTETAEPAKAEDGKAEEKPKPAKEPEREDPTTLHERTIAALSYFGFLAIVPFYLKKDSEFCQFHGKQGLFLAIFFFLTKLFTVVDLLFDLMLLLQVAMLFIMGFAALSGRWRKLPFGYDWACQMEEVLTLKTKAQEEDEVGLMPNELSDNKESK